MIRLVKEAKKKEYYQICPYCKGVAFVYHMKPYKGMKLIKGEYLAWGKSEKIVKCDKCGKIILTKYLNKKYLGER